MDSRDQLGAAGARNVAGAGDLIADIHRQQRRRVFRRAAQVTALAIVFLMIALAVKLVANSRDRARSLQIARGHFTRGTTVDLREAAAELEQSLERDPGDSQTRAALALARVQAWLEFGEDESGAREAVLAVEELDGSRDAVTAVGMVAFADGDDAAARSARDRALTLDADDSLAPAHVEWLGGLLVMRSESSEELSAAIEALGRPDVTQAGLVAYRRLRATLQLQAGDGPGALAELERAREQSRAHMGLAADEALYHAYLRRELSAVADVADQLLAADEGMLGSRDRAHALVARGVVHVHTGEVEDGVQHVQEAWKVLPPWDRLARTLALQTMLEAGQSERAEEWIGAAGLPPTEAKVYGAWARLARGDIMGSLAALAELPQEHPRVAYLQALALVEQLRFEEAGPWIDRAEKVMPGRVELEVARARVELRSGDVAAALGKLRALAEEEPYAPRAWTGLGEARLAQEGDVDFRGARSALERAIKREPVPAEALLRLAELWNRRRTQDPKAEREALELLERAAEVNAFVPRYRQALAMHLADLGQRDRAIELLRGLVDVPGVESGPLLQLVRLTLRREMAADDVPKQIDDWLEAASKAGAADAEVERERARLAIARGTNQSLKDARERLRKLLEVEPGDIESRVLYSEAAAKLLDREDAELAIRKGLQATPYRAQGRLYLAWARIEARTGKRQRAASHARLGWLRILDEDRPAVELLDAADLATGLWLRHGKPKVALSIAREVTSRLASHSDAWTIRAGTELRANRSAEALQSAERALDLDDANPRAHELHGHCLLRFGYKDRARKAYEKAIELTEGTAREQRFRENLTRL